MLLLVFRHVDPDHVLFVVKQEFRQRSRQFRLADPGRAQENEATDRPLHVLKTGPRAADGVRQRRHGRILAYHAPVQPLLQVEQPFRLALHEPRDRDTRAFADQCRN